MDCPATLNKSGRGEDGKYFSLWEPDVRLDEQYLWRSASHHSCICWHLTCKCLLLDLYSTCVVAQDVTS